MAFDTNIVYSPHTIITIEINKLHIQVGDSTSFNLNDKLNLIIPV